MITPVPLRGASQVTLRAELSGATSSNLKWKPAVRYADSRQTLPSGTEASLGSEQSGNGLLYVERYDLRLT